MCAALSFNRAHLHLSRLNTREMGIVAFADDPSGGISREKPLFPKTELFRINSISTK